MNRRCWGTAILALGLAMAAPYASAQATTQGISKNEILLGTVQDLSGPVVSIAKPTLSGMQLRVEQINAAGGINGRKLKLLVEDTGYDPKRGVLGVQKLANSDKVFAFVGNLGTAISLAVAPIIAERNILNLFPISAHRGNFEPFSRYRFALITPFDTGIEIGLNELIAKRGYKRVGILYQDDELGLDNLRATEKTLKAHDLGLVEKASYKRGATDFSSQSQRLVANNPDLIVMATTTRETIGATTTLRQLGYKGDFLGSIAAYQADVARLGGPPLEGFQAIADYPVMYRDDPKNSPDLNAWMDAYNAKFSAMPDGYSATGWVIIDILAKALQAAGPEPTTDKVTTALETLKYGRTFLGNPPYAWGPNKRLGGSQVRVSQVKGSRWTPVSDFLELK